MTGKPDLDHLNYHLGQLQSMHAMRSATTSQQYVVFVRKVTRDASSSGFALMYSRSLADPHQLDWFNLYFLNKARQVIHSVENSICALYR